MTTHPWWYIPTEVHYHETISKSRHGKLSEVPFFPCLCDDSSCKYNTSNRKAQDMNTRGTWLHVSQDMPMSVVVSLLLGIGCYRISLDMYVVYDR